jgi:hypothetical protein
LVRKLFSANPARIGRFECAPVTDGLDSQQLFWRNVVSLTRLVG